MSIEITRENKIKQDLKFRFDEELAKEFENLIVAFLEDNSNQKFDGTIKDMRIEKNTYSNGIAVHIVTEVEDRLKLIENGN